MTTRPVRSRSPETSGGVVSSTRRSADNNSSNGLCSALRVDRRQFDLFRQAGPAVLALHGHHRDAVDRHRRTEVDLDLFGGHLTDPHVEMLHEVLDDRDIEVRPTCAQAGSGDDPARGDHSDLGAARADGQHEVSATLVDRHVSADGRCHRCLHQEDLPRPGGVAGIAYRPLLDPVGGRAH